MPVGGEACALAAAAMLLSSAVLIYLSLAVPDYIRPDWTTPFAVSGVPCIAVGLLLLRRRRLPLLGIAAVVLFGDVAIVLSGYASLDRNGTTAGALLSLPTLFTATFLAGRWLVAQVVTATGCAWLINSLVPAGASVHVIRTSVLVIACTCPAVIVMLLRRQLDRAVLTDPLTGLMNRRGLDAHFPAQLARAQRAGQPIAVLLVDVDHFKRINDDHGHLAGDEVLRQVAATIRRCTRAEDLVVRLGGEEVVVVLVADHDAVRQVAHRINREVASASTSPAVTVSIGTAWAGAERHQHDPLLLQELVSEADRRMYEAKHAGRNRVAFPSRPDDVPTARREPRHSGDPG